MGRTYCFNPDPQRGERSGIGYRIYTHTGSVIRHVWKVAFDRDPEDNRGMATVGALVVSGDGTPVVNPETNQPTPIEFRAWVQVVKDTEQPIRAPQDDLVPNPMENASNRGKVEPYVLFSLLEKQVAEIKQQYETVEA